MSCWKLILNDGKEITEKDVEFWDNVPKDVTIRSVIVSPLTPPHVIFENFDEISIARLGAMYMDGQSLHTGYVVSILRSDLDMCQRVTFRGNNISTEIEKISDIKIPRECFRKGVI